MASKNTKGSVDGVDTKILAGFEEYTPSVVPRVASAVTVQNSGLLSFNFTACSDFGLYKVKAVKLLWNKKDRIAAVVPVPLSERGAIEVKCHESKHVGKESGGRKVLFSGFLATYGIPRPEKGNTLKLEHGWMNDDPKTGIIVLRGF